MLPPANQPFMDDHIAYALVLVALPWPAPAHVAVRTRIPPNCHWCAATGAALTATHGRTGQVS